MKSYLIIIFFYLFLTAQSSHRNVIIDGGTDQTSIGNVSDSLKTKPSGLASTLNSSSTPLGSNATFTGTFEDVTDYPTVSISLKVDQPSAADGWKFQWSSDCSNVDLEEHITLIAAGGYGGQLSQRAKCFRVVYTNGSVAQSVFRLGTVFRPSGSGLISKPLNSVLTTENFAQPVHALVAGKVVGSDTYQDLLVDALGNLIVTSITGFGSAFSFGDVALASASQSVVRRTTYTEQSSNAQRSVSSANANDTSAGTGARTMRITYYTSTGTGPFTEDITLNGTTAVNTSNSDICFIERMVILTAGSSGSNTGIITLFASTAGGGGAVGTIAATNNQTFWCHHYVPTSKIANITGVSISNDSNVANNGSVFVLKARAIPAGSNVLAQISDFVSLFGQSSSTYRSYTSPIKVTGPAKIECYVTPNNNNTQTQRMSFDFFEQ